MTLTYIFKVNCSATYFFSMTFCIYSHRAENFTYQVGINRRNFRKYIVLCWFLRNNNLSLTTIPPPTHAHIRLPPSWVGVFKYFALITLEGITISTILPWLLVIFIVSYIKCKLFFAQHFWNWNWWCHLIR